MLLTLTLYLVFSAMRTFALSSSKALTALVFILSLAPLGVNVVGGHLLIWTCHQNTGLMLISWQAHFGIGFGGYVDPVFGCLTHETPVSEIVNIGYVHYLKYRLKYLEQFSALAVRNISSIIKQGHA